MKASQLRARRVAGFALCIAAFIAFFVPAASAQVGYDPSQKLEVLGESISNCTTGAVAADFTLADDVQPGYQVIAAGFDPNDQPRSVLAVVTPVGTTTNSNGVVVNIHVTSDGFKPCTTVKFSVRFPFPQTGPVVEGPALPFTGSKTGFLVAIASAAILIGIALVQGARIRARMSA